VKPVVVVGGGIVGACTAFHLARAGTPVTVIFRDAGVTPLSFAWIGASPPWPGGARDLSEFVLPDWRALAATVPGVEVDWFGPSASSDGAVDPARVTRALLLAARRLGARTVAGASVTAVRDGLVSSTAGQFPASAVVVAAGTGTPALCPQVAVPASPAFRMRLRAPRGLVRAVVATDHFEVREASPGLLLATAPLGADRSPAGLRALAGRTADRLRTAFGSGSQLLDGDGLRPLDGDGLRPLDGDGLRPLDWAVGERPMPPGGPVIGQVTPGVHVAVMHSAICLAPVAGRLLAGEIRTGRPSPLLAGCRPG